jgi:hypothetical protein
MNLDARLKRLEQAGRQQKIRFVTIEDEAIKTHGSLLKDEQIESIEERIKSLEEKIT